MPTYEYQCETCAYKFEAFQQITEKPLEDCPKCRGALKRLIGAGGGFIFKGNGFYATDYRSQEYREKQKQESKQGPGCPASGDNQSCKQCPMKSGEDGGK